MDSARVDDDEVLATIADVYARADGYTLDPHSAIGVAAARRAQKDKGVAMVCLACAHWAKFPDANTKALGSAATSRLVVPDELAQLANKPTRVAPLPNDIGAVRNFIEETLASRTSA